MVRLFRPTHVASVALLLALPGWTTGAGELFKAVVGMADAADTNRLAQSLASAVSGTGGTGHTLTGTLADVGSDLATTGVATAVSGPVGIAPAGTTATTNTGNTLMGNFIAGQLGGGSATDLGDGLSWNWGTKGMIDLMTGFMMAFMMGSADPNSALNIYGSALLSQDPVQLSAAMGDLLTAMDLTCAFHMTAGGDGVDMKFRDGREALHVQFVPTTASSVFHFNGNFPQARAFSYATYAVSDKTVSFVDMISDVDVVPATGANPFLQGPSLLPVQGTYDVYVTPDGKKGYANEIAGFPQGKADGPLEGLIIVYRVIMADGLRANGWGNVDPPALRMRTLNLLNTGLWINLAPCNPDNNKVVDQFVKDRLTFQEDMSDVRVECDVFNMENNFVYYDDAQYFKTPDENHVISCANKAALPPGAELITMISGVLPPQSDSRYASLSLVNLYPPGRNIYTVSDQALRNFYMDQGKSAVNYTIIMARNRLALNKCGLSQLPSNWYQVYWSGFADARGGDGSYQGVVYREVMTNGYEQALEQVRYACAEGKQCSNPKFFERQMGEFYPRISYLMCGKDGQIHPAPIVNPNVTFAEPVLPTPAPQGIWTSLAARKELGVHCQPQVTVDVAALQGSDVYIDGKLAGRATDNAKVVTRQQAAYAWSPIQAVYYDEANPQTPNPIVKSFTGPDGAEVKMELVPTPANFLPEKVQLAVRVPVTTGAKAFFAAYDACGLKGASAAGWKCKAADFGGDRNWTLAHFDDSDWLPAKVTSKGDACQALPTDASSLPPDAQGIWVDTCTGGAGPASGFVYCRKTLPQKCDLSCAAGSPDRAQAWCPDRARAMATARFASPTLHWLYANGKEVGGDQTMVNTVGSTSFPLDRASRTLVLAFKAVDDTRKSVKSFIKGQFNVCGYEVLTEAKGWKCAPSEPFDDAWTKPGFDDAAWSPIKIVDGYPWQPAAPAGVTPAASWVWSPKAGATDVWCRVEVPNPVFEPLAEVEIQ